MQFGVLHGIMCGGGNSGGVLYGVMCGDGNSGGIQSCAAVATAAVFCTVSCAAVAERTRWSHRWWCGSMIGRPGSSTYMC